MDTCLSLIVAEVIESTHLSTLLSIYVKRGIHRLILLNIHQYNIGYYALVAQFWKPISYWKATECEQYSCEDTCLLGGLVINLKMSSCV